MATYKYNEINEEIDFDWEALGDIEEGRKNLGLEMSVSSYRLFQLSLKNVLIRMFGVEAAIEAFRSAGNLAGQVFAQKFIDREKDFSSFVSQLQEVLKREKIGIARIEKADLETLHIILSISEDLDCSGLPVTGETVCEYDEGFIAGILFYYSGKKFMVEEIDCWANGGRTCRFEINPES